MIILAEVSCTDLQCSEEAECRVNTLGRLYCIQDFVVTVKSHFSKNRYKKQKKQLIQLKKYTVGFYAKIACYEQNFV